MHALVVGGGIGPQMSKMLVRARLKLADSVPAEVDQKLA